MVGLVANHHEFFRTYMASIICKRVPLHWRACSSSLLYLVAIELGPPPSCSGESDPSIVTSTESIGLHRWSDNIGDTGSFSMAQELTGDTPTRSGSASWIEISTEEEIFWCRLGLWTGGGSPPLQSCYKTEYRYGVSGDRTAPTQSPTPGLIENGSFV